MGLKCVNSVDQSSRSGADPEREPHKRPATPPRLPSPRPPLTHPPIPRPPIPPPVPRRRRNRAKFPRIVTPIKMEIYACAEYPDLYMDIIYPIAKCTSFSLSTLMNIAHTWGCLRCITPIRKWFRCPDFRNKNRDMFVLMKKFTEDIVSSLKDSQGLEIVAFMEVFPGIYSSAVLTF